jgi:adenine-specific DNA methylase
LAVSRCVDYSSANCVWGVTGEFIAHTFGRQALPIVWDFAEANLLSGSTGSFAGAVDWVANVAKSSAMQTAGQSQLADAVESPLPEAAATVWFTDPPYYDAVPYADLSDFFFVWLKRCMPALGLLRDPFDPSNTLTPKNREAVRDEQQHLDRRQRKSTGWY